MSNNRPDSSKGSKQPGNGGTKDHRDGMKNPADADVQRGSIGETEVDLVRGHGKDTVSSVPNKDLEKNRKARDKQVGPS